MIFYISKENGCVYTLNIDFTGKKFLINTPLNVDGSYETNIAEYSLIERHLISDDEVQEADHIYNRLLCADILISN